MKHFGVKHKKKLHACNHTPSLRFARIMAISRTFFLLPRHISFTHQWSTNHLLMTETNLVGGLGKLCNKQPLSFLKFQLEYNKYTLFSCFPVNVTTQLTLINQSLWLCLSSVFTHSLSFSLPMMALSPWKISL